ncbi:MAG: hypothetical protein AAB116_20005 [Candidatus Poribacteria bacterium]
MTNKEHCKATEIMLGLKSHIEIHQFMDGFYKSMGWAHRSKRHDHKIITTMQDLYGEDVGLEAAFHIACDMNVVTKKDLEIWKGIIQGDKAKPSKRRKTKEKS